MKLNTLAHITGVFSSGKKYLQFRRSRIVNLIVLNYNK